jgi:hypothetical protein
MEKLEAQSSTRCRIIPLTPTSSSSFVRFARFASPRAVVGLTTLVLAATLVIAVVIASFTLGCIGAIELLLGIFITFAKNMREFVRKMFGQTFNSYSGFLEGTVEWFTRGLDRTQSQIGL